MIQGRQGLLERQQPGTSEALLAFCDQRGAAAFRLPWYARWAPLVEPLLAEARACPSPHHSGQAATLIPTPETLHVAGEHASAALLALCTFRLPWYARVGRRLWGRCWQTLAPARPHTAAVRPRP